MRRMSFNRQGSVLMLSVVLGIALIIMVFAVISFAYSSITFTAQNTNNINALFVAESALNETSRLLQTSPALLSEPINHAFPYEGFELIEWLRDDAPGYVVGDMKLILQDDTDTDPDTGYLIGVGTDKEYTRAVRVQYDYADPPTAPAAMYMRGDNINPSLTGAGFSVSGEDHRSLSGSPDITLDPVNGIAVSNADSLDAWMTLFSAPGMKPKAKKITGEDTVAGEEAPDIADVGEIVDIAELVAMYEEMATRVIEGVFQLSSSYDPYDGDNSWGTPDDPEVVVIKNDIFLNGNFDGTGVLVVQGDLELKGNFTWQGLVIVQGDFTVGSGSAEIWGATLIDKEDAVINIDLAGSFDIRYSTEAISFLGNQFFVIHSTWEEVG